MGKRLKVQDVTGNPLSTDDVANLPQVDETGNPMLALESPESGKVAESAYDPLDEPDLPTCKICGKMFAVPREGNICCVCLEKAAKQTAKEFVQSVTGSAAPKLGSPETVAEAEVEVSSVESVKLPTDTIGYTVAMTERLSLRCMALRRRVLAWSGSGLEENANVGRTAVAGAADAMVRSMSTLLDVLRAVQRTGYQPRSTAATRKAVKLMEAGRCELVPETHAEFEEVYGGIGDILVKRIVGDKALLETSDGVNIGLVDLRNIKDPA